MIKTDDGSDTAYWSEYGESFNSACGAFTEAKQLYIDASGFAESLRQADSRLHVLDVGLGLGYNAMSTIDAWLQEPTSPDLTLSSVEKSPDLVQLVATLTGDWQALWSEEWRTRASTLTQVAPAVWTAEFLHPISGAKCSWQVFVGDALQLADTHLANVDFVWQDAFSPKKNPEMWTVDWFAKLHSWCSPTGLITSYSVARTVKDALQATGWNYEMINGTIGKRHWLLAKKNPQ